MIYSVCGERAVDRSALLLRAAKKPHLAVAQDRYPPDILEVWQLFRFRQIRPHVLLERVYQADVAGFRLPRLRQQRFRRGFELLRGRVQIRFYRGRVRQRPGALSSDDRLSVELLA